MPLVKSLAVINEAMLNKLLLTVEVELIGLGNSDKNVDEDGEITIPWWC
jgi:hypothetical protein